MNKLILVTLLIALAVSMHLNAHEANATSNASAKAKATANATAHKANDTASHAADKAAAPAANATAAKKPAPAAKASADNATKSNKSADSKAHAANASADNKKAESKHDANKSAESKPAANASADNKKADNKSADNKSAESKPAANASDANASAANASAANESAAKDSDAAPERKEVKYFVEPFTDTSLLIREELARHNELRAKHGSPPLEEDKDLTKAAQQWADQLVINQKLDHSTGAKAGYYGENLYKASAFLKASLEDNWDADERDYDLKPFDTYCASNKWYSEVDNYDFKNNKDSGDSKKPSGHFSALVWKNVKKVGFGYGWQKQADSQMFDLYVVARYTPVPRVLGQYKDNVLPAKEEAPKKDA